MNENDFSDLFEMENDMKDESDEKIMITEFQREEVEEKEVEMNFQIDLPRYLEEKLNKNVKEKEERKTEKEGNEIGKLEAGLHFINPLLSIEDRKSRSRYNVSITQLISRPLGSDKNALDQDVKNRSDFSGDFPIHHFGEAMLKGMGWEKGNSIGWSNKKVIPVKELASKTDRKGLGFK